MCGTYHSMMNFELRVVSAADFKTYLQARAAGKSNAEALKAINQAPLATSTHPFDTRRGEQVTPPPQVAAQASDSQAVK
jgi:cytochrome c oxidase subunit 2